MKKIDLPRAIKEFDRVQEICHHIVIHCMRRERQVSSIDYPERSYERRSDMENVLGNPLAREATSARC